MSHVINLLPRHQRVLIQALIESAEIKARLVIRDPESLDHMNTQYADAGEKFLLPVRVHDSRKNLFTWFQDQIAHTPHLRTQELGVWASVIADSCSRNCYREFCGSATASNFHDIFEFK
jgi:hypothetical protein